MLRKAHDLLGFQLHATNGEIGQIDDFYFDDETWTVRYIVVDTGTWIFGRKVLIAPDAVTGLHWEAEKLSVALTRDQVENSPEIDTDKPISRQHEVDLYTHYGWSPYWAPFPAYSRGVPVGGMMTGVPVATAPAAVDERQTAVADVTTEDNDPHLRGIKEVTGYHIQATDEEIGHVEDFFVSETDWVIRYLLVDTRNWWPGKNVLIAPDWIDKISWLDSKVHVNVTRQQVKESPEYEPNTPVHRDYEATLYHYYGFPGYWM